MKYDVCKGTREDFKNAKGVRIGRRCDENDIAEIIRKSYRAHSAMSPVIMNKVFSMIEGRLFACNEHDQYLWLEEAM